MTFSYNADLSNLKDWIRFRLGDTDPSFYLLEDEEIEAIIALTESPQKALLETLKGLLAKLSKMIDQDIGDISINLSKIYENYLTLFEEIKQEVKKNILDASAPFLEDPNKTRSFKRGVL